MEKLETGQLAFSDKLVMPGAIYVRRLNNKDPTRLFHKFTASTDYIDSFVLSVRFCGIAGRRWLRDWSNRLRVARGVAWRGCVSHDNTLDWRLLVVLHIS